MKQLKRKYYYAWCLSGTLLAGSVCFMLMAFLLDSIGLSVLAVLLAIVCLVLSFVVVANLKEIADGFEDMLEEKL